MSSLTDMFEEGYRMGAAHVIEFMNNRLFYIPEAWKEGEGKIMYELLTSYLKAAEREYIGGADNGK